MYTEPTGRKVDVALLGPELVFTTARSSGPGGQNVNKVNSKVIIRFAVPSSGILTAEEKQFLLDKLAPKLTREGELVVSSQEMRSQLDNKAAAIAKFNAILRKAYEKPKPRRPTKPTRSGKEKRMESKRINSEKKRWRQRPE